MLQTTRDDVIFSGHGCTLPEKGQVTRVPLGVEFYMMGPPGVTLTDHLGQMLEGGLYITTLFITSPKTGGRSPLQPVVRRYQDGAIPNLALDAPRDIDVGGQGVVPHIIGVEAFTSLQDLWPRLKPFIKPNHTIRVFWGSCTSLGADGPEVDGE